MAVVVMPIQKRIALLTLAWKLLLAVEVRLEHKSRIECILAVVYFLLYDDLTEVVRQVIQLHLQRL